MSDNIAVLAGYTKEINADCAEYNMDLLVQPDADFDGTFRAWDMHEQEFIRVNGWLWTISETAQH